MNTAQVTLNEPKEAVLAPALAPPAASAGRAQPDEARRTAGRAQLDAGQGTLVAAAAGAEADVAVPGGPGPAVAASATVAAAEEKRKTVRGNLLYGGARRTDPKTVAISGEGPSTDEARARPAPPS